MANRLRLPWRELWGVFPIDNVPLAYVLFKSWSTIFGESELALRSLSALSYAAAIAATGLAARVSAGAAAGLLAAVLMATSVHMGLAHAGSARGYALLSFAAAGAVWQTVRLTDSPDESRRLHVAALFLTHLSGLFIHPSYVVFVTACALTSALVGRRVSVASTIAAAGALVVYVVSWQRVLQKTMALQTIYWMQPPSVADVQSAAMLLWGTAGGLLVLTCLSGCLILAVARRPMTDDLSRQWVVSTAVAAWALALGISLWKPIFEPTRTPMLLLPITVVALAIIVVSAGGRRLCGVVAAAMICFSGRQIFGASRADPYPTGEALAYLLQHANCDETVVATGLSSAPVLYYLRRSAAPSCLAITSYPLEMDTWAGLQREPEPIRALEREAEDLSRSLASTRRAVWLLTLSRGLTHEISRTIESALSAKMQCRERLPLRGAFFDGVLHCVPSPDAQHP
jgi:mannosyltransferase